VRVDAQRVGRWRFVTLCRTVDSSRDVADLDINLDLMPDKERTVVRLGLNGSLTVTDKAALDACLDKYARLFAALVPWDKQTDIAVIPADGEFDDLGIGGFAAAAVDELVIAARSDGEDADDARAALALLLRLVGKGSDEPLARRAEGNEPLARRAEGSEPLARRAEGSEPLARRAKGVA
jgi:hypothetical protein